MKISQSTSHTGSKALQMDNKIMAFASEKPGMPSYNWRIGNEKICDSPESYLISAERIGGAEPRTVALGTVSLIGDWYFSARVEGIKFATVAEAEQFFADNITRMF